MRLKTRGIIQIVMGVAMLLGVVGLFFEWTVLNIILYGVLLPFEGFVAFVLIIAGANALNEVKKDRKARSLE